MQRWITSKRLRRKKMNNELKCAACGGLLGTEHKSRYASEPYLIDRLYEAWAIGGRGPNNLWCYDCLDGFMSQHGNGHLNSYDIRWEWDEEKKIAVRMELDSEKIKRLQDENDTLKYWLVYAIDDIREVEWMCMSETFKDDAVRLLGENNEDFKIYTDRLKQWADWQMKRGRM
jgi:hypothetical protein